MNTYINAIHAGYDDGASKFDYNFFISTSSPDKKGTMRVQTGWIDWYNGYYDKKGKLHATSYRNSTPYYEDIKVGQSSVNSEDPILNSLGIAGYVSHGMIGTAAGLTSNITYRYGQRVNGIIKSATQLTSENAEIWGNVTTGFNIFGGALGAGVNGIKTYDDIQNSETGWATFHGSIALSYAVGIGITILFPECGYGEYLLISTMAVDFGGEGVKSVNGH